MVMTMLLVRGCSSFLLLLLLAAAPSCQAAAPLVATSLGDLQGIEIPDSGVDAFLGIQYAKVGERFSVSTLNEEPFTNGTYNASSSGPWCYQARYQAPETIDPGATMAEECLFLDIWRPSNFTAPISTMVWIHGGGLETGSGAAQYSSGGSPVGLPATQGILQIGINYRLGALGFLVQDESGKGGLNGIEDQVNALRWIKNHVKSFGGDPSDITIFGESAGSWSTGVLSVSPLAKGLFQRSILQSGPTIGGWAPATGPQGYQMAQDYLEAMGVSSHEDLMDRDAFPAEDFLVLSNVTLFSSMADGDDWPFHQMFYTVDGHVLMDMPSVLFQNAENINPSSMMIGSTSYDGIVPLAMQQFEVGGAWDNLTETTSGAFGEDVGPQVLDLYWEDNKGFNDSNFATFSQIDGDYQVRCGSRELAAMVSKSAMEGNVYLYTVAEFSNVDPMLSFNAGTEGWELPHINTTMWTSHAGDLGFLFGWGYAPIAPNNSDPIFTPKQMALSQDMQARWASFAKTGDPNYDGVAVPWTPVTAIDTGATIAAQVPSLLLHSNTRMLDPMEKVNQCSLLVPFYSSSNVTTEEDGDNTGSSVDTVSDGGFVMIFRSYLATMPMFVVTCLFIL